MAKRDQQLQDLVVHLPSSFRDRVEEMASRECISLNLFVLMAVAEKLQRLQLQHCLEMTEKETLARDSRSEAHLMNTPERVH